ncbi:alpha/beta hydrolase [Brevibacterium salitolerans]|uniref:AB hydrolase-1 domain-containing protein n=1 Tax=Brevibacterium salitolerans TaxID=1403566 RepID=A0ABN2X303_9MICO
MSSLAVTTLGAGGARPSGADLSADLARSRSESDAGVLVLLPSLGTAAAALWKPVAELLPAAVTVLAVDLPGHGSSPPVAPRAGTVLTIEEMAEAVLTTVRAVLPEEARALTVAGDSVGGAIALRLALDHPETVERAAVFCSGAKIGEAQAWEERAALVEREGTATQVAGSRQRWFAPGFADRRPAAEAELIRTLLEADRFSYAAVCRGLAAFDVRERLQHVRVPLLAVAGAEDSPTPPAGLRALADGVPRGRYCEVPRTAHLVPAEAPETTAELLMEFMREGRPGRV